MEASRRRYYNEHRTVTGGGALRTGPLAMHPSVGFASLAKGDVNKEWRFLSDTPLCRLSDKISGCKKCPQGNFLAYENELFGRCHHQLILAALLPYQSTPERLAPPRSQGYPERPGSPT